ncbi:hypothetical protein RQP46_007162 [Phenoliferia psychrophenolica]
MERSPPWLYAVLFSLFFTGLIMAQGFEYFQTYRDDRLAMKLVVAALLLLTVFEAVLSVITLNWKLIINFGDEFTSTLSPLSTIVAQFITSFTCAMAQAFFAHRTIALSKHKLLACGLGAGIFINLGAGLAQAVVYRHYFQTLEPPDLRVLLIAIQAWSWLSALIDVAISSVFIYYMLIIKKPFTDYDMPANGVAGKLLMMSFQTAAITSLVATANAITVKVVGPKGQWSTIFSLTLPNLFVM